MATKAPRYYVRVISHPHGSVPGPGHDRCEYDAAVLGPYTKLGAIRVWRREYTWYNHGNSWSGHVWLEDDQGYRCKVVALDVDNRHLEIHRAESYSTAPPLWAAALQRAV